MTDSQQRAIQWLADRGGDACFTRHGQALAQGEVAPFARSTWNNLRDAGRVEYYGPRRSGCGFARLRLAVSQ